MRGALLRSMIKKRRIRGAYGVMFQQQWDQRHERGEFAQYIGNDRDKYMQAASPAPSIEAFTLTVLLGSGTGSRETGNARTAWSGM